MTDLAKRAVACRRWRPLDGARIFRAGQWVRWDRDWTHTESNQQWLPDLDDPATLGCLLTLVREAWGHGEFTAVCSEIFQGHCCVTQRVRSSQLQLPDRFVAWGHSEAEALVAALEAAP